MAPTLDLVSAAVGLDLTRDHVGLVVIERIPVAVELVAFSCSESGVNRLDRLCRAPFDFVGVPGPETVDLEADFRQFGFVGIAPFFGINSVFVASGSTPSKGHHVFQLS